MSSYYVGVEEDITSVDYGSMVATAENVGLFLRALNDGSLFIKGEEGIYSSLYEYDQIGLNLSLGSGNPFRKKFHWYYQ